MIFFCKNQISKIFASILMKKKNFNWKFFKNLTLQPPKLLLHNGFKHQKWKLGLTCGPLASKTKGLLLRRQQFS